MQHQVQEKTRNWRGSRAENENEKEETLRKRRKGADVLQLKRGGVLKKR